MRFALILLFGLLLASCSYFHGYHPDFQQGNIMTPQQLDQLHVGMSKTEAEHILGEPILQNSFNENRLLYAYTYKTNNGPMLVKQVALTFQNGRLIKIEKNLNYQPPNK